MQTRLTESILNTPHGRQADGIIRQCVHCGFCTATCPTYQLLGDELDGPRGRIYLIKEVLEGATASAETRLHLDRCLTCLACETTCPSGVRYRRLLDIGRETVEQTVPRPVTQRVLRWLLRTLLPYPQRFAPLLRLGQGLRPLLPPSLKRSIPPRTPATDWPPPAQTRKMIVLDGCVQPALAPGINASTARVLDQLGISLLRPANAGCCGAVSHHLSAPQEARRFMRNNIDAWWPLIEQGAEAIVITASGCGTQVKDYGELLQDDPDYADKATRIAAMTRDLSEILASEDLSSLRGTSPPRRIAFHSPCSLQHGQGIRGQVETILTTLGHTLTAVPDSHLCCGSAGTYSILQASLARQLRRNKVTALASAQPDVIATANIGCLTHLQAGTDLPVCHWVELLI